MAEWFTQNRYDINGLSTKALIEWAKDEVDTARHFARVDNPERSPADMLRNARWASVEDGLITALQTQAPRNEVIEGVDRVLAAAQRYWQAATASGLQIIATSEQASQQQAGKPAGQDAQAAVRRT